MKVRIKERNEFPVVERILTLLAAWAAGCSLTAHYFGHRPIPNWMHIQVYVVWIAIMVYFFWKFKRW